MNLVDFSYMDENFNYSFLKLKNTIEDHNYDFTGFQKMVRLDQVNADEEISQTSSVYDDDTSNSKSVIDENCEKTTITISRSSSTCTGSKSSVAIIYPCYLCNYETYRSTSLVAHLRQHRQGTLALETERFQIGKFVCNICNYKTRWLSSLKEHEQKTHYIDDNDVYSNADDVSFNVGPFICRHCDFSTEELGTIAIHMKCHFTSTNLLGKIVYHYPCCLCEFTTEQLDELQDHFNNIHYNGILNGRDLLTSVPPSSRSVCTKCDYIFTDNDDMILHLQKHDQSDTLEYPCDYCSHRSASIHLWRDHMESHGGVLEISLASVQD